MDKKYFKNYINKFEIIVEIHYLFHNRILTITEIAKKYNVDRKTIYNKLKIIV